MRRKERLDKNFAFPMTGFTVGQVRPFVKDVYKSLVAAGIVELSVDCIAYSDDFEAVYDAVSVKFPGIDRNYIFRLLMGRRKSGGVKAPKPRMSAASRAKKQKMLI